MGVDPAIDITAAERSSVLTLLERHLPGTTAWVYGSRAKWTSTPQSDLDLVVFSTPEQRRQVGDLREAFDESNLPFRVDLFVWDDVPESFRNAEHVVLSPTQPRDSARDLRDMTFTKAFLINPSIHIERGSSRVFVDMATVDPNSRSVRSSKVREFRGYGSRFQDGDTLMARITPCLENGKVARYCADGSREPAHGSTEFIIVRGRPGLTTNEFAYYMTRSSIVRDYAIDQMTGTSGRQRVRTESLEHLTVAVPPLLEQRRVADVLGTLDDKIELNRRMNATLEAMVRALFKSWFGDFDAVRAKMEGRDTGLPKRIAELFPDRMVESELGQIPDGWPLTQLSDLIELNPSRRLQKGHAAPYLDMAKMPTRGHAPESVVERPFGSGMRFANGDTLMARITPCLENGKTAFVDFLRDREIGWGSTEYIVMCPYPPFPKEFAYCLARSEAFREFAIQSMSGTSGRQRVPVAALSGYMIPRASDGVAAEFGRIVHSIRERASRAVSECRKLAGIRDALLPKLLSGDTRVRDVKQPTKRGTRGD